MRPASRPRLPNPKSRARSDTITVLLRGVLIFMAELVHGMQVFFDIEIDSKPVGQCKISDLCCVGVGVAVSWQH